jgi:hypothetical protein
MERLNLNKESLRKFGITMSAALAVIALIISLRHRHDPLPACAVSAVFLAIGLAVPGILKWPDIIWMKFAFILGWVNTRLILCLLFYLFFTPISIGIKILTIDLLDRKLNKDADSYWNPKGKAVLNPKDYERQF